MKKTIACLMIFAFVLLCACSNTAKEPTAGNAADVEKAAPVYVSPDYLAAEKSDNVLHGSATVDVAGDISDAAGVYAASPVVALVRIDSILGGGNYSEINKAPTSMIYTYGKMTVLEVFKGDISVGDELTYYRSGGTMKFDDYYENLTGARKEKYDYNFSQGETRPEYITEYALDDIAVEAGKTYLVYLKADNWISGAKDAYDIGSLGGSLREVENSPQTRSALTNAQNIRVLNNFTGEWEAISDVIPD